MPKPLPFEQIPLAFLYRTGRMFEAECLSCEAMQHVYFPTVLKRFGKTVCLADIAGEVECLFCGKPGIKVLEINVGR